jgi:hypothetical protein
MFQIAGLKARINNLFSFKLRTQLSENMATHLEQVKRDWVFLRQNMEQSREVALNGEKNSLQLIHLITVAR